MYFHQLKDKQNAMMIIFRRLSSCCVNQYTLRKKVCWTDEKGVLKCMYK